MATDNCLYPQFSLIPLSKSYYQCEICPLYHKWAIEKCIKHSKLKCKGYDIKRVLAGKFQMNLNGMCQVYEHAISKPHKEAIDSISSHSYPLTHCLHKGKGKTLLGKALQGRIKSKQLKLDFFFKSRQAPLNL